MALLPVPESKWAGRVTTLTSDDLGGAFIARKILRKNTTEKIHQDGRRGTVPYMIHFCILFSRAILCREATDDRFEWTVSG